ncbi:putative redox protein [Psychrobacter aquaticus]|uniref:Putative redox protein n=1 Tax=Psychrobacter aquaticus CMS 56 TaxID=1354303 RepID=U4T393_9GAMM|nr:putative redox protein [Psychrobacter aquaticus]ERL55185.1 putative redox protein [Psychrobacter aquaticus CMS 56]
MSEYFAKINWVRDSSESYVDNKYSRGHEWIFDGGVVVQASSSPHVVSVPYSVEENVDPEEAFVASLSSCHIFSFCLLQQKENM